MLDLSSKKPQVREWLTNLLSSDSAISSARAINVGGFFTSTGLMVADFAAKNALDSVNFGAYLTDCAGGFAVSKALDYAQAKKEPQSV